MTRFRMKIVVGFLLVLTLTGLLKWGLYTLYLRMTGGAIGGELSNTLIGWGSFFIVGALVTSWLVAQPRREFALLTKAARRLRDGDLSARVEVPAESMTAPVGLAFNEMAQRLETLVKEQEELLQLLSHELRTPMSRARFVMDEMIDATSQSEREQSLAALDTELTEMDGLISEVLAMTRERHEHANRFGEVHLTSVLDDIVAEIANDTHGIDIVTQTGEGLPLILVQRAAFARAVRNLLSNAVRHARTTVWIEAYVDARKVTLAVEDDGPGIPEEERDEIFNPFVSKGGVGLGLAIVDRIVRAHGSKVAVTRGKHRQGGRFETCWPIAPTRR